MATYDARLTSAGFLGDVEVNAGADSVTLRGSRAPQTLLRARIIVQWSMVSIGLLGFFAGYEWTAWLIPAAVVFSLFAYLALWWVASDQLVRFKNGAHTEASTGWVFRWYDIFWLGNFLTAIGLFSAAASEGKRTVRFTGPGYVQGSSASYVLVAANPGEAALLTTGLLGLTSGGSAST